MGWWHVLLTKLAQGVWLSRVLVSRCGVCGRWTAVSLEHCVSSASCCTWEVGCLYPVDGLLWLQASAGC